MSNEEILHFIDKLDERLSSTEKWINYNFWVQTVLLFISISHIFIPSFDKFIEEKINLKFEVLEQIIPVYLTFLLIRFYYLNFLYIQFRQNQITLIRKLKINLKVINRKSIDRIYRKQIFTEYWFRLLFLKEFSFNKIPSLFISFVILLVLSFNQAISLFFTSFTSNLFIEIPLTLSLIIIYIIFSKQLLKVFLNKIKVKRFILINLLVAIIIYTLLRVITIANTVYN